MEPEVRAQGLPVGSASIEITSVPSSSGEPPVQHAATARCDGIDRAAQAFLADFDNMERAASEFKVDMNMRSMKMHRCPASIRALGDLYTAPKMVAIGPYHHDRDYLKPTEKVKHVAAYLCIRHSDHTVEEMCQAVFSVAEDARSAYGEGISDDEFLPMMFYDACFLLQYMRSAIDDNMDLSLMSFFSSNAADILHDIMLLENQLPWLVVETVMTFVPVDLAGFIYCFRGSHDRRDPKKEHFALDSSYKPPHLLGLVRYYLVGISKEITFAGHLPSLSVSISGLAEIGITLAANDTNAIKDMRVKKGPLFAKLCLAPIHLGPAGSSLLINMAAHELCVNSDFGVAEDSAVCSYLRLLAMLVHGEEDVRELRTKRILLGIGITDKEAVDFFSRLHALPLGVSFIHVMGQIEDYMFRRRMWTKVHAFLYRNGKIIVTAFSVIGAVVGILKALQPLTKGS